MAEGLQPSRNARFLYHGHAYSVDLKSLTNMNRWFFEVLMAEVLLPEISPPVEKAWMVELDANFRPSSPHSSTSDLKAKFGAKVRHG